MEIYQCKKCYVVIEQENFPQSSNCKESWSGHIWENLGDVGNKNYQCSKCLLIIKSDKIPQSAFCKESWIGHNWKEL